MPLFTPHNGLQFMLSKLDGTLTLTFRRNGKKISKLEISEIDTSVKDEKLGYMGTWVTAVGLELHLIKNDGTLELEFVGDSGGSGSWVFNELGRNKSQMVATAGTQTDIVVVRNEGVQTENMVVATKEMAIQTDTPPICSTSTSTQTDVSEAQKETENERKRKRPCLSYVADKRARYSTESDPWPKHLFMSCQRVYPFFKGSTGVLHLDLEKAKIWFEGSYGTEHNQCKEAKQVDLHDPTTDVQCVISGQKINELILSRETKSGSKAMMFKVEMANDTGNVWGNDDGSDMRKLKYPNAMVILDATVHCIDRTSRRQPIHDPITKSAFKKANAKFEALNLAGLLDTKSGISTAHPRVEWNLLKKVEERRLHRYKQKRQIVQADVQKRHIVHVDVQKAP